MTSTSFRSQHSACVVACFFFLPLFASGLVHAQPLQAPRQENVTKYPDAPLYKIGDRHFRIPWGYVRFADEQGGGTRTGVSLHMLLPDFLPYSRDTRREFDYPTSAQVMDVSIRVHDAVVSGQTFPVMTRAAIYERILRDLSSRKVRQVVDKPGPYGLIHRQLVPPAALDRELFVGLNADGSLFWVLCSADTRTNPQCDTQIEYSPHVTVKYFFSKKLLGDWQTLDEKVIAFVHRFQQ